MRTMEALACNICKEPAWNFMCMSCVGKDVREFLPQKLRKSYMGFHNSFSSHFDSAQLVLNGAVYCMNCRSTRESPVCPNCYTSEVFAWLEEKDSRLAKKFMKMFSFGRAPSLPAEDGEQQDEEYGICDECGEYTDELIPTDGEWICKECSPQLED